MEEIEEIELKWRVDQFLSLLTGYPDEYFEPPIPTLLDYLNNIYTLSCFTKSKKVGREIFINSLLIETQLFWLAVDYIKIEIIEATREMFLADVICDLSILAEKTMNEEDKYRTELIFKMIDIYSLHKSLQSPRLDYLVQIMNKKLGYA